MSKIDVIMTSYNCDAYISAAIKSILVQTYQEFNFIVIDDGSTDGTNDRIREFKDPRIKYFPCKHAGRAHALNYALALSGNPYIAFMDADDCAVPDRLRIQYEFLQKHPEIDCVSGWFDLIDEQGNNKGVIRKLPEDHGSIQDEITIHCSMCFPATMMRREALKKVDNFDMNLQSAVDYDFFLNLIPTATFYNVQKVLLHHRIHSTAISSNRTAEQMENTRRLSQAYLLHQLDQTTAIKEQYAIYFTLGLTEYYNGSMQSARSWFMKSFPGLCTQYRFWRYFIPSFLGKSVITLYRKYINRKYSAAI